MKGRITGDLSTLPAAGFSSHDLWFWAGCGFMVIEGAGFSLAYAVYVYLMSGSPQWPMGDPPPDLFWGTAQTLLLLASLWPTFILSKASRRRDAGPTQLWSVVLTVLNALALVIRAFEFPHLNAHWDVDAYGSIVFCLMLLHTTHLVTDFIDTGMLTAFLFTHPMSTERFSDVDDDCVYWAFVVATWLPIYALVYLAPRLAG